MSDAFTDVDRWINTVPVPYRSKNASMDRVKVSHNLLFFSKQMQQSTTIMTANDATMAFKFIKILYLKDYPTHECVNSLIIPI